MRFWHDPKVAKAVCYGGLQDAFDLSLQQLEKQFRQNHQVLTLAKSSALAAKLVQMKQL
jgi:hypothetical protein